MAKIVVVGDFNMDLVLYMDRFPQAGETLNGNEFFEGPGGKGSNQAIAAARLGADVTFFGAIGKDHYAAAALQHWGEAGIDTSKVIQSDEHSTAVAMIYVNEAGDNMIVVAQAANLLLTPQHVEAVADVIAAADVLMCTLGVPLDVVERALQIAKANGTKTVLNTAPAARLSAAMLEAADYLTPNESELAIITGAAVDSDNLVESARGLLRRDDQTFIITLGGNGSRWITRTDSGHIPAYPVEVLDTVGAGDAFNAGLAVGLAEGQSIEEAIQFASAAAGLSVMVQGAVAGMPMREAVEAFIAAQ